MADSIEKHAKEQSSFFAIGAGHLGGAQGVIELLKKKGFRVTPVHSNNKISLLVVQNMIRMTERARKKHEAEKNKEETTTLKIDTEGTKEEIPPPIELELGRNIPETKPAQPVKPKTKKKP
jgi:outer membrane biosynthesis protein TonB